MCGVSGRGERVRQVRDAPPGQKSTCLLQGRQSLQSASYELGSASICPRGCVTELQPSSASGLLGRTP